MKTIGLIGGMSWESSLVYYNLINKKVKEILGGFHSSKSIMVSVDFDEIQKLQHQGDWDTLDAIMVKSAKQLEIAGADIIILCTNTMHLCSNKIIENTTIPFLHIANATGEEIIKREIKKVALLGTKFTMEKDFYKNILIEDFGIEVIIPTQEETNFVSQIFAIPHFQALIRKKHQLTGMPVADPFVIACAYANQACVVSEEALKANAASIPNICKHFGIECTNIEGMMEREDWEF